MAEEQTQPVEQTQEQPVQQENVSNETQEATTTEPSPRPVLVHVNCPGRGIAPDPIILVP